MATKDMVSCKCGGKPVVAKTNQNKWRVMCPNCQRFYTKDKDSREDAVSAWNENIEAFGKKKSESEPN